MVEVGAPAPVRVRPGAPAPFAWLILSLPLLAACGATATDPDNAAPAADVVTAQLPPVETTAPRRVEELNEAQPAAAIAEAGNTTADPTPTADPAPTLAPPPLVPPPTASGSRYTSLDPASCKPVAAGAGPAGSARRRCPGSSDYALETGDGDPALAIVAPDGRRSQLDLSRRVAKARLGKTAEWRGTGSGGPRALIVRVEGAARGGPGGTRSDLIVARLGTPACIVSVIPRGPRQNEKARAAADGDRLECIDD